MGEFKNRIRIQTKSSCSMHIYMSVMCRIQFRALTLSAQDCGSASPSTTSAHKLPHGYFGFYWLCLLDVCMQNKFPSLKKLYLHKYFTLNPIIIFDFLYNTLASAFILNILLKCRAG